MDANGSPVSLLSCRGGLATPGASALPRSIVAVSGMVARSRSLTSIWDERAGLGGSGTPGLLVNHAPPAPGSLGQPVQSRVPVLHRRCRTLATMQAHGIAPILNIPRTTPGLLSFRATPAGCEKSRPAGSSQRSDSARRRSRRMRYCDHAPRSMPNSPAAPDALRAGISLRCLLRRNDDSRVVYRSFIAGMTTAGRQVGRSLCARLITMRCSFVFCWTRCAEYNPASTQPERTERWNYWIDPWPARLRS